MIEAIEFGKRYGERFAVSGLSFQVSKGEILGLVGPNGAGKTTTLQALAGILSPTTGRLVIRGHDLAVEGLLAKRRLAYVPDTPHPFPHLSVEEHVAFFAAAYGTRDAARATAQWIDRLELSDRKHHRATELSRGLRQKLALACALVHDPEVLLLDEPLSGLDPAGVNTVREVLLEVARDGKSVILSSHRLDLVERVCARVLVMNEGRLIAWGTIQEIAELARRGLDATLEEIFFELTRTGEP